MSTTNIYKLGSILGVAAALSAGTGCTNAELGPGDYLVFRVAQASSAPDANCFQNKQIPPSLAEDSTSLLGAGSYIMYATEERGYFLDAGKVVLEGKLDVDGYDFRGELVDVEVPAGTTMVDSDHDGFDDAVDDFVDADGDGLNDKSEDPEVDVDMDGLDDRGQDDIVDANGDGVDDRFVEVPSPHKFRKTNRYDIYIFITDGVVSGDTSTTTIDVCEGSECPKGYGTECTSYGTFDGVVIQDAHVDLSLGANNDEP